MVHNSIETWTSSRKSLLQVGQTKVGFNVFSAFSVFHPFRILGQYSVFTAFLEQGDEVIMFEPFFDQYLPSVVFNGGKPVYVPLHPPADSIKKPTSDDWTIDIQELRYVSEFIVVGLLLKHFQGPQ